MKNPKLGPSEILVLRTCADDSTSYGGFHWPDSGWVEAPDWEPTDLCGNGLHGLPWGAGAGNLLDWNEQLNNGWLVAVPVDADNYRTGAGKLADKCKFRRGRVVGARLAREECARILREMAPAGTAVCWTEVATSRSLTLSAGGWSTLSAGGWSTLSAGDGSTLSAGYGSKLSAGDCSKLSAGDGSTLSAGDGSTLSAGGGSVFVVTWYDGTRQRVATKDDAQPGEWWTCKNGEWKQVDAPAEVTKEGE